ncbi:MAG: glycosyltransferase family 4 protein [Balneolaceae bacterium]
MKILMVLERNFPPDVRVEHEIHSLISEGHEVSIACFDQKKAPRKEQWNGATIYRKPISSFIYKTSVGCLKFPFYFLFWRSFIFALFKKQRFDAIHIHDLPLAKIGVECKRKFNAKFVLDLHENWPALLEVSSHVKTPLGRLLSSDKQWRKYENQMIEYADDVIVVIDESEKRLLDMGHDGRKIHIVSNTPSKEDINLMIEDLSSEEDVFTLFYGGGVTEHRGLQFVIRALNEVENDEIHFSIVGDGSYLANLKELSETLNLSKKITFWGWKSLSEMTEIMKKAHVLLIPHKKSEHTDTTIPHKLFQYMATEKPILATNCKPIQRIIEDTNTGFIYEFDNISSIKNQINTLFTKWRNRDSLKTEGAGYVRDKYNWDIDEKVLLDIYKN